LQKKITNIALQCKTNPKKFWNFVNNKFKIKNKIGNLSIKNSLGSEETTNNDNTKAEILNICFTSVFVKEENTEFTRLNHIPNIPNMDLPIVNEEDILNRLKKLI